MPRVNEAIEDAEMAEEAERAMTPGQRVHAAFFASLAAQGWVSGPVVNWESLTPMQRAAYEAAAQAVLRGGGAASSQGYL